MGILIYFNLMHCPHCGYTSFKAGKKCGNCNFDLKKSDKATPSLVKENFTIFAGTGVTTPTAAGILETDESVFPSPVEEGIQTEFEADRTESPIKDFELDLSEAMNEIDAVEEVPQAEETPTETVDSLDFDSETEIDLEAQLDLDEIEVEGLGFEDLEPISPESTEKKTPEEDTVPDLEKVTETPEEDTAPDLEIPTESLVDEGEDLSKVSSESAEMEIDATFQETDSEIEETEIALDIGTEPEVTDEDMELNLEPDSEASDLSLDIDSGDLEETQSLDLGLDQLPEKPQPDQETVSQPAPLENEISLEIDESFEPPAPDSGPPELELDALDVDLEIAGPEDTPPSPEPEEPVLEIDDLGLELEPKEETEDSEESEDSGNSEDEDKSSNSN